MNPGIADKAAAVPMKPGAALDGLAEPGTQRTGRETSDPVQPDRPWPALDGLRAVAVCAVIAQHLDVFPGGYLGVDVFFVLSGFLITSLLIREWDQRGGTVRLRDFYARRALRLLPALACVLVAAVAVGVILELLGGNLNRALADATFSAIPWVLLFAGNFVYVFHPGVLAWGALGALSHTWSLAIEEQFYLLWPSVFVLCMRRGIGRSRLALSMAALSVSEMVYRILLANADSSQFRIYDGTDTHSDGLLLGCAIAFWLASSQPGRLHKLTRPAVWLASLVLLALFTFGSHGGQSVEIAVAVLASGVLVAGVVLGELPAGLERLLCSRLAVRTGSRSYGLYLWHFVLLGAAADMTAPWARLFATGIDQRLFFATVLAVAVAASFVMADLSYRFVELPALRRKRRFQHAELP